MNHTNSTLFFRLTKLAKPIKLNTTTTAKKLRNMYIAIFKFTFIRDREIQMGKNAEYNYILIEDSVLKRYWLIDFLLIYIKLGLNRQYPFRNKQRNKEFFTPSGIKHV